MFFRQSRKLASPLFFLAALLLVVLLVGIASAEEFTPAMIRKVSSAVKLLVTGDGRGNIKGQGTGFFISSDGHMLTNYHVVEGSREIVIWENKKLYEVSRVVAFNKEADVALLETKYPKSMIHVLPLRNNMIELGESIMVLGYPKALRLGTAITLTKGNVSSIRPVGVNTLVQFTAPIAGGSSGSPIIDKNGKVAGIVTSELTLGQGMFLGLSSPSILKHVARHIPSGGSGRTIAAKPTPTPKTPTPTPSKAIPLPTTGATALTAAEIREAQGILNELGFNAGSVDGKAGAQTKTAVKAFQRNRGVTQDGKLTKAMLEMLRSVKRERTIRATPTPTPVEPSKKPRETTRFSTPSLSEMQAALKAGADPKERDKDGNTLLHIFAAMNNPDPKILTLLMKNGVDPKSKGKGGRTPLHLAARWCSNSEVIVLLLKAGINVNEKDETGLTSLHYAAIGNQKMISMFLKARGNLEAKDNKGRTPLHAAATLNPSPEAIMLLLKAGANLNARNYNDETPLHMAAGWNPNPEVITTLLKAGADAKARCKDGKLPIDYADKNKNLKGTAAHEALRRASR